MSLTETNQPDKQPTLSTRTIELKLIYENDKLVDYAMTRAQTPGINVELRFSECKFISHELYSLIHNTASDEFCEQFRPMLNKMQFRLFRFIHANPGHSGYEILERVWHGRNIEGSHNLVSVYISNINRKIRPHGWQIVAKPYALGYRVTPFEAP